MAQTIDVTGLPEPIIRDIERLVATLRARLRQAEGTRPPASELSAEAWIARFNAWAESHPRRDIEIDDSRETIYAGRGE
jgi:hypothetical protein